MPSFWALGRGIPQNVSAATLPLNLLAFATCPLVLKRFLKGIRPTEQVYCVVASSALVILITLVEIRENSCNYVQLLLACKIDCMTGLGFVDNGIPAAACVVVNYSCLITQSGNCLQS